MVIYFVTTLKIIRYYAWPIDPLEEGEIGILRNLYFTPLFYDLYDFLCTLIGYLFILNS